MAINVLNIVGGPATISRGGIDLGATLGGVKISTTEELTEKECDQCSMTVGILQNKMGAKISCVLAEMSAANLAIVLGSSGGAGRSTAPAEAAFEIKGAGPSGKVRTVTIHKGVIAATTEIDNKKGEQQGLAIEILLIADLTKSPGSQLFTYADA